MAEAETGAEAELERVPAGSEAGSAAPGLGEPFGGTRLFGYG